MPQAIERLGEIREPVLRGVSEHAKRSQDGKTAALGFAPPIAIINEHGVRGNFLSKGDGGEPARAETLVHSNDLAGRGLDPYPVRPVGDPLLHDFRRVFLAEFAADGGRDEYATVECLQDVSVFNENQIPERSRISNDDH